MYILLKQLKKALAMLLSIMILITALPVFAFADEFEKTQTKRRKQSRKYRKAKRLKQKDLIVPEKRKIYRSLKKSLRIYRALRPKKMILKKKTKFRLRSLLKT